MAKGSRSKAAQAIDDTYRWQAAMGAIAGAIAAEAHAMQQGSWGPRAIASVAHAESLLGGAPIAIELEPVEAFPVAVGLAAQASPLLIDTASVDLIDVVRQSLAGLDVIEPVDPGLVTASELEQDAPGFVTAVDAAANPDEAILVGGLYGLRHGVGGIPARLISTLADDQERRCRRYLTRLTDRLLGIRRNDWFDPRSRRGPKQVLPGLWLANLHGIASFVRQHPDGLVVSLCDVEGRIADHGQHITFHLDDTPNPRPNPSLRTVLDEALDEVRSARSQGQPVLVHCRHGASRTGLILRLLLVEEHGVSAEDVLAEAQALWSHTSSWNSAWNREVERRART